MGRERAKPANEEGAWKREKGERPRGEKGLWFEYTKGRN